MSGNFNLALLGPNPPHCGAHYSTLAQYYSPKRKVASSGKDWEGHSLGGLTRSLLLITFTLLCRDLRACIWWQILLWVLWG